DTVDRDGVLVFHAGTVLKNGRHYTNGGRVLGIAALGSDRKEAREKAYRSAARVHFEGVQYRKDIAK
ncbi:MAG TPA: phosphoribosylglycinamide synthetase C domain-containing protein, partial [Clostridia bacterium]|nr:phosphoribosylglycinamide synthetase C domain-containing protein [Clostridia bacterium]